MAGNVWSIKIIPGEKNVAQFAPDVFNSNPGDPLYAQNADLVAWNNQTDDEHQPWPSDSTWTPVTANGTSGLCDPIQPWTSSTPAYLLTGTAPSTIYYVCLIHPSEHGQINIVTT